MADDDVDGGGNAPEPGTGRTPPYISFATFLTFLKALKADGLPPQIDKSVLSKLSGGVQGQMKLALRSLGLMAEGDKPTPHLEALVDAYDTPALEGLLLERLKATYPYVFQLDLMTATPTMFADAFKVTGAKEDVLRKCRTFFLHAAKRAGVPLGNRLQTGSVPRPSTNNGTRRKPRTAAKEPPSEEQNAASAGKGSPVGGGPDPLINRLVDKFPDFDPTWNDEIKAKWFANFDQFMKMTKPK